jgi:hypothetical protein
MSELIKALCKYTEGRGSKEEIGREVADVLVTVGVLEYMSPESVEGKRQFVLKNLEELLRKGKDKKERGEIELRK